MEYSNCIIAIQGNHLHKTKQLFECFKYVDLYDEKQFKQWEEAKTYLTNNFETHEDNGQVIRGLWFENGRTIICDPEMSDTINDEPFELLSEKLNAPVLIFL